MLVLSRKKGERIMIGKDIVLTVLAMEHNKIRLGIDAPDTTKVYREEIWAKLPENRREQDGQRG